ncbi:MAG: hypothetical protein IPM41_06570 [Sphingomonadales bacterium]|nr:hypothetical protein [Sphingomonadales bacterium]
MDNSQLAALMLEWEATQRKADALAETIKGAVLAIGKTQVVGNVRATYSAGRRTFDYRAAVDAADAAGLLEPGSLSPWESENVDWFEVVQGAIQDGILDGRYLAPFTETVIDYAAAAKGLNLDIPASQTEPSVTLKLA